MIQSVIEAETLRTAALVSIEYSKECRRQYIAALARKANDDELRHIHLDALAAASAADKATARYLGVRTVEYAL